MNADPRPVASLFALALLASGAPAAAQESLHPVPWYVLTEEGGGLGEFVDDVVIFSQVEREDPKAAPYWIAERLRTEQHVGKRPVETVHQWIDGRSCPALAGLIARGAAQPPQAMLRPDANPAPGASDIRRQRFSGPAADPKSLGGARVSWSGYGSARFRWWNEGERALKACWSSSPVADGGRTARPQLSTPENIRDFKTF